MTNICDGCTLLQLGNKGGNSPAGGEREGGGGGGGAGSPGGNGKVNPFDGGDGGDGYEVTILGYSLFWAAGGGGSGTQSHSKGGNGGRGGGGGGSGCYASPCSSTTSVGGTDALNDGTAGCVGRDCNSPGNGGQNTGSGGGAGTHGDANPGGNGGDGGSGIVIVRILSVAEPEPEPEVVDSDVVAIAGGVYRGTRHARTLPYEPTLKGAKIQEVFLPGDSVCKVLLVGGGGAGGAGEGSGAGAGGAGGVVYVPDAKLKKGYNRFVIGRGGNESTCPEIYAGGSCDHPEWSDGVDTVFGGYVAKGGGGGGSGAASDRDLNLGDTALFASDLLLWYPFDNSLENYGRLSRGSAATPFLGEFFSTQTAFTDATGSSFNVKPSTNNYLKTIPLNLYEIAVAGPPGVSVCFWWILTTSTNNGNTYPLSNTGAVGFGGHWNHGGTNLYVWNGASSVGINTGFDDNTWRFACFVWDDDGNFKWYRNGAVIKTASNYPPRNEELPLVLGEEGESVEHNLLMDDLRVYDRELLASEVSQLYSSYLNGERGRDTDAEARVALGASAVLNMAGRPGGSGGGGSAHASTGSLAGGASTQPTYEDAITFGNAGSAGVYTDASAVLGGKGGSGLASGNGVGSIDGTPLEELFPSGGFGHSFDGATYIAGGANVCVEPEIPVSKQCDPRALAKCPPTGACLDILEQPNHHHIAYVNSDGTLVIEGESNDFSPTDTRVWTGTCDGVCDGIVGTWTISGHPVMSKFRVSADFADDYADEYTYEGQREELKICRLPRSCPGSVEGLGGSGLTEQCKDGIRALPVDSPLNFDGGGWTLVRRVAPGGGWHPATDNLYGSQAYGSPTLAERFDPTADKTWSVDWSSWDVDEIMLAHGTMHHWLITTPEAIHGDYSNAARSVIKTSNLGEPHKIVWYNRANSPIDPLIGVADWVHVSHDSDKALYLEDSTLDRAPVLQAQNGANVFVRRSNRVRHVPLPCVDLTGTIQPPVGRTRVLTGSGSFGSTDAAFNSATFADPRGVCVGPDFAYTGTSSDNRVRAIRLHDGYATTLAGGSAGLADGIGTSAQFKNPYDCSVTKDGATVYVSDTSGHRIRAVDVATGQVTTLAGSTNGDQGSADGEASVARFFYPYGVTVSPDQQWLYVNDVSNFKIRVIRTGDGYTKTLTGAGSQGYVDGEPSVAKIAHSYFSAVSEDGQTLYVADYVNRRIRTVDTASGYTGTLCGTGAEGNTNGPCASATFHGLNGIGIHGDYLYVTDEKTHNIRAVHIPTKTIAHVAGSGSLGYANGDGAAAQFKHLWGITYSATLGLLLVGDSGNYRIRTVVPYPDAPPEPTNTVAVRAGCSLGDRLSYPTFWMPATRAETSLIDVVGGAKAVAANSPDFDVASKSWCFNEGKDLSDYANQEYSHLTFEEIGLDMAGIQQTSGFSVSLWIKVRGNLRGHALHFAPDVNTRTPYVYLSDGSAADQLHFVTNDGQEIFLDAADHVFHHFVWVANTDLTHSLFLDGELAAVTNAALMPVSFDGTHVLRLGHTIRTDEHAVPFDGCVKDLRMYDAAMTNADVRKLYAASEPQVAFDKKAWLPFPKPKATERPRDLKAPVFWAAMDSASDTFKDAKLGVSAELTGSPRYNHGEGAACFNYGGRTNEKVRFADLPIKLRTLDAAEGWTISLWFKRQHPSSDFYGQILQVHPTVDNTFPYIIVSTRADTVKQISYVVAGDDISASGTVIAVDNAWQHLALTSLNGDAKLYLDGVLVEEFSPGLLQAGLDTLPDITLGNTGSNVMDQDFIGCMRDLRVYDFALSANNTAELYGDAFKTPLEDRGTGDGALWELETCSCPEGYIPIDGACFIYFDIKVPNFDTARSMCADVGGIVAKTYTHAQWSYLFDVQMNVLPNRRFWYGLTDRASEGTFVWEDGTTASDGFVNWGSGQPNNGGSGEDCTFIQGDGNIHDIRCDWSDFVVACSYKPCESRLQLGDSKLAPVVADLYSTAIPGTLASLQEAQGFTAAVWARRDSGVTGDMSVLVLSDASGRPVGDAVAFDSATGVGFYGGWLFVAFESETRVRVAVSQGTASVAVDGHFGDNRWVHIAVTVGPSGTVRAYVNGELGATMPEPFLFKEQYGGLSPVYYNALIKLEDGTGVDLETTGTDLYRFGADDFTFAMRFTGLGADACNGEADCVIFYREISNRGPSVALHSASGDIRFRLDSGSALDCAAALVDAGAAVNRTLVFTKEGSTLSVYVDGERKCSGTRTTRSLSDFASAKLQIGYYTPNLHDLYAHLSDIEIWNHAMTLENVREYHARVGLSHDDVVSALPAVSTVVLGGRGGEHRLSGAIKDFRLLPYELDDERVRKLYNPALGGPCVPRVTTGRDGLPNTGGSGTVNGLGGSGFAAISCDADDYSISLPGTAVGFVPGKSERERVVQFTETGKTYTVEFKQTVIAELLVVAGGGAGGTGVHASGAGAGGVLHAKEFEIQPGIYTVKVGAGGVGGKGENSEAFGASVVGGGAGLSGTDASSQFYGADGGSGGGAGVRNSASPVIYGGTPVNGYTGGVVGKAKTVVFYGNPGGQPAYSASSFCTGGGGGAGGPGKDGSTTNCGTSSASHGGDALLTTILGSTQYVAAGGAGLSGTRGLGGSSGLDGAANTGEGGSANAGSTAAVGGSGIVVLRYRTKFNLEISTVVGGLPPIPVPAPITTEQCPVEVDDTNSAFALRLPSAAASRFFPRDSHEWTFAFWARQDAPVSPTSAVTYLHQDGVFSLSRSGYTFTVKLGGSYSATTAAVVFDPLSWHHVAVIRVKGTSELATGLVVAVDGVQVAMASEQNGPMPLVLPDTDSASNSPVFVLGKASQAQYMDDLRLYRDVSLELGEGVEYGLNHLVHQHGPARIGQRFERPVEGFVVGTSFSTVHNCECAAGFGGLDSASCEHCPPGTFKSGSGFYACQACPVGTFSAAAGSVACTDCREGTTTTAIGQTSASACKCSLSPLSDERDFHVCPGYRPASYAPVGRWYAGMWDGGLKRLYNKAGLERPEYDAVTQSGVKSANLEGHGSYLPIPFIYGDNNDYLRWPSNILQQTYTVCSVTAWGPARAMLHPDYDENPFDDKPGVPVDTPLGLPLSDGQSTPQWALGHAGSSADKFAGVAWSQGWATAESDVSSEHIAHREDWVVSCRNSHGEPPGNFLFNNEARGTKQDSHKPSYLQAGHASTAYQGIWALHDLIVWDISLPESDMRAVSECLLQRLHTADPAKISRDCSDLASLRIDGKSGKPCPEGHYCPGGAFGAARVCRCFSDSPTGSDESSDCQCKASFFSTCDSGYFVDPETERCVLCAKGYYCELGTAKACAAGFTSNAGAGSEKECLAKVLDKTDGACGFGYYEDAESCLLCPQGAYCIHSAKYDCPAGNTSQLGSYDTRQCSTPAPPQHDGGLAACRACPVSFYCPAPGEQIACPENRTSPAGSDSVSDCVCDERFFACGRKVTVFNTAIVGEYTPEVKAAAERAVLSALGLTKAEASVSSSVVPQTSRRLLSDSQQVEFVVKSESDNEDSNVDSVSSESIESAMAAENITAANTSDPSTTSNYGQCPANTARRDAENSRGVASLDDCECLRGYYGTTRESCQVCPAGTFKADNGFSSACQACPIGTYQPAEGATACLQCGFGLTTARNGTTAFNDGFDGCVCGGETQPQDSENGGPGPCVACPPNSESNPGFGSCRCKRGFRRDLGRETEACEACPLAFQVAVNQSQTCTCEFGRQFVGGECKVCPDNSRPLKENVCECNPGSYDNNTLDEFCDICPKGFYCPTTFEKHECGAEYTTYGRAASFSDCACSPAAYGSNGDCTACPALSGRLYPSEPVVTSDHGDPVYPAISVLQDCVCLPGSQGASATECEACQLGYTQVQHSFNISCQICPKDSYCPDIVKAPTTCPARTTPALRRDNSRFYSNCGNRRAAGWKLIGGTSPMFGKTFSNIAYQGSNRQIGRLTFHPSQGGCQNPGFTPVIGNSGAAIGSYKDGVGLNVHFVTSGLVPSCDIEDDGAWICYIIEQSKLRQINMDTFTVTTIPTVVPVPASGGVKRIQKTDWVAFRGTDNEMYIIYLSSGWVQKVGVTVTTSHWTASAFAIYWAIGNNMYHFKLDTGTSEHLRSLSGNSASSLDVDPDGHWVFYTYVTVGGLQNVHAVSRYGHLVGVGGNVFGVGHPFKGPYNPKWAADGSAILHVWCDAGGCGVPWGDIIKVDYSLPAFESHTGNTQGNSKLEACVCPAGTYGNISDYLQDNLAPTCYYAEEGQYSPGLPFLTEPFACPSGNWSHRGFSACTCRYSTYYDQATADCKLCPAGHHRVNLFKEECEPCPLGFYKPEGEVECLPAPVTTFANTTGLVAPYDCPPNSITLLAGVSIDECKCKPGYYDVAESGENAQCRPCATGFAQPERDRTKCEICPVGTYSLLPATPDCLPCEQGFECAGWIGRTRCTAQDVIEGGRTLETSATSIGLVKDVATGDFTSQPVGSEDRRWVAANPERYGEYEPLTYEAFVSSGETTRNLLTAEIPTPYGAYWPESWDRVFNKWTDVSGNDNDLLREGTGSFWVTGEGNLKPYVAETYRPTGFAHSGTHGVCNQFHLDGSRAWCPPTATSGFLQADLGALKKVDRIITQGRQDQGKWTTSYKITYHDGETWHNVYCDGSEICPGNFDQHTKVYTHLPPNTYLRYFRVTAVTWHSHASLRIGADRVDLPVEDPGEIVGGLVLQGVQASRLLVEQSVAVSAYSVCVLAKYNGGVKSRIIASSDVNNIFGHWAGRAGVAHWNGWRTITSTQPSPIVESVDDWLVYCGSEGAEAFPENHWVNGHAIGTATGAGNLGRYGVNAWASETSDWAVRQLLVWDHALDGKQLKAVSDCLLQIKDGGEERLCYGIAEVSDGSFCDSIAGLGSGGLVPGFMGEEATCVAGMTLVPAAGNSSAYCAFDAQGAGGVATLQGGTYTQLPELDFATAYDVLAMPDAVPSVELNTQAGWIHIGPKDVSLTDRDSAIAAVGPAYQKAFDGTRSKYTVRIAPPNNPQHSRLNIYGYSVTSVTVELYEVLPDDSRVHFITINDEGLTNAPIDSENTALGYQRLPTLPFAEYTSWSWFLQQFNGKIGTTNGLLDELYGRIENKQTQTYLDAEIDTGYSGTALKVPAHAEGVPAQYTITYNNPAPLRAGGFTHLAVVFWAKHDTEGGFTRFIHFNNQAFMFYYQDDADCTGFTIAVSGTWGWTPHRRKCAPFPDGSKRTEWHHVALSVYGDRGYYARNFRYILMIDGKRTYFTKGENTHIPWFQCLGVSHAWGRQCAYGSTGYSFQSTDHTYWIDDFETFTTALDEEKLLALYRHYKPSLQQRRVSVDPPRSGTLDVEVTFAANVNGSSGLDLVARDSAGNLFTRPLDVSIGFQSFENVVAASSECPVGYYGVTLENGGNGCRECPVGATTASAASPDPSACFCKAGFRQVSAGTTSVPVVCEACPEGFYKEATGDSACLACPNGQPGLNGALQHQGGCACLAGTVYNASSSQCEPCPAGQFCKGGEHYEVCPDLTSSDTGSSAITDCGCAAGFYQLLQNGTALCQPCLLDHYCLGGAHIAPCSYKCPPGEFVLDFCSAVAETTCQPCKAGTAKPDEANQFFKCDDCLAGYYENEEGQHTCKDCGNTTFCPFEAMTYPIECPLNSVTVSSAGGRATTLEQCWCVAGFQNIIGETESPDCAGPEFNTTLCADVCQPCEADWYCPGDEVPRQFCQGNANPRLRSASTSLVTDSPTFLNTNGNGLGRLGTGYAHDSDVLFSYLGGLYWLTPSTGATTLIMPGVFSTVFSPALRVDGVAGGGAQLVGLNWGFNEAAGFAHVPGTNLVLVGEWLPSQYDSGLRVIDTSSHAMTTLTLSFASDLPDAITALKATRSVACHEDQLRCFVHSEHNGNHIFQVLMTTGFVSAVGSPGKLIIAMGFDTTFYNLKAVSYVANGAKTVHTYGISPASAGAADWVFETGEDMTDAQFDTLTGEFLVYTKGSHASGFDLYAAHMPSQTKWQLPAVAGTRDNSFRVGMLPAADLSSSSLDASAATMLQLRQVDGAAGTFKLHQRSVLEQPAYQTTTFGIGGKASETDCSCPAGTTGLIELPPLNFCKKCPSESYCQPDAEALQAANTITACASDRLAFGSFGNETDCVCDLGAEGGDVGPCSSCPVGTERTVPDQESCSFCPGGYFAGAEGQVRCDVCAPGSFSPPSKYFGDHLPSWHSQHIVFWMPMEPGEGELITDRRYELRQAPTAISSALELDTTAGAPVGYAAMKVPKVASGSPSGMQWNNDQIWPRGTTFTMSFWFKAGEGEGCAPNLMTEQILWHMVLNPDNADDFALIMGGGGQTSFGGWTWNMNGIARPVDMREWHHYALVKGPTPNAADSIWYVDGVPYPYSNAQRAWSGSTWYGQGYPTNTIPTNGQISSGFQATPPTMFHQNTECDYWVDDVRFYDGIAASKSQIKELLRGYSFNPVPDDFVRKACTPCAKGFRQPYSGRSECELCPEGTYNDVVGATHCIDCGSDFVCPGGMERSRCVVDAATSTDIEVEDEKTAIVATNVVSKSAAFGRIGKVFRGYNPRKDQAKFTTSKVTKLDTSGTEVTEETNCIPSGVGTGGVIQGNKCLSGFVKRGNECELPQPPRGQYVRFTPPRYSPLEPFRRADVLRYHKKERITAKSGYLQILPTEPFSAEATPTTEDAVKGIVANLTWVVDINEEMTVNLHILALPRCTLTFKSLATGEILYSFDKDELEQFYQADPSKRDEGIRSTLDFPAGGIDMRLIADEDASGGSSRRLLQESNPENPGANFTMSYQSFEEGGAVNVSCPIGFFGETSDDGDSFCLECPANFTTLAEASEAITDCLCAPGHFLASGSDINDGVCSPCPSGTYKDTTADSGSCQACPGDSAPHSADFVGRSDVAACYCGAGTVFDNSTGACEPCPIGAFCLGAHHQEDCPAAPNTTSPAGSGTYELCQCDAQAGTGLQRYLNVENGQYESTCDVCPADSFCVLGDATVQQCTSFSASDAGSDEVTDCLCIAGYYGPTGGPCFGCEPGFFCPGSTAHLSCPAFSTSLPISFELKACLCAPRYYDPSNTEGEDCQECPEDHYCPGGALGVVDAPRGLALACPEFSTAPQGFAGNVTDCTCNVGTFLNGAAAECNICPVGFFCDGTSITHPCPYGQSSPPGSGQISQCYTVEGFFGVNGTDATICQPGFYCPGGIEPKACPENTTSAKYAFDEFDCVCVPGTYDVGNAVCVPCLEDHYCPSVPLGNLTAHPGDGLRGPIHACPALSIVDAGKGTDITKCQCNVNTFLSDGGECTQCQDNLFTRGIGAVGSAQCGSLPGYFDASGGTSPGVVCPANTYCEGFNTAPTVCPEFSNSTAQSTSVDNCTCFRTYFKATLESGEVICTQCALGEWFVEETEACATCTFCAAGQFAAPVCRGSTDSICHFCQPGTISIKANQPSCSPCPPRTYQDRSGKTSCKPCGASYGCAEGSAEQTFCPIGTFADGAEEFSGGCEPCAPGYFNLEEGQTECSPAPRGTFSPGYNATPQTCGVGTSTNGVLLAASECVPCPAGSYGDVAGQVNCKPCPAGHFCPGYDNKTLCSPGTAAPKGSAECSVCPAGAYSDTPGAPQCKPCPVGVACEGGSAFEVCQLGEVAAEGSDSCLSCAPGSFSDALYSATCQPCPAGFNCGGLADKQTCPKGTYAPEGSTLCSSCPTLMTTLGNATGSKDECGAVPGYYLVGNDVTNVPTQCPEVRLSSDCCVFAVCFAV